MAARKASITRLRPTGDEGKTGELCLATGVRLQSYDFWFGWFGRNSSEPELGEVVSSGSEVDGR